MILTCVMFWVVASLWTNINFSVHFFCLQSFVLLVVSDPRFGSDCLFFCNWFIVASLISPLSALSQFQKILPCKDCCFIHHCSWNIQNLGSHMMHGKDFKALLSLRELINIWWCALVQLLPDCNWMYLFVFKLC